MNSQFGSATIVVLSIVLYQLCMKSVPEGVNPVSALVTFYVSALLCTLLTARLFPGGELALSFSDFSWQAALVGVAIVGIELGYLLMYRSGWNIAVAPLMGMGIAAVILAVLGALFFRQPATFRYFCGLAMCLYGFYLIVPANR